MAVLDEKEPVDVVKLQGPSYPGQTMSDDRKVRVNYHFLKKQLNHTPIVPMQQECYENILHMVQDTYKDTPQMNRVVEDVFDETRKMYHDAMHKSVIQNVLIAPLVKGLENEVAGPPPKEPQ